MLRTCRGLTLIETLVVMGIVAILSGLLLVIGRTVLASAKTTSCFSNLNQIGTALTLYGHDNDERYPPFVFQATGSLTPQPQAYKKALENYKVDDRQFYCPLDTHARSGFQSEHENHVATSYSLSIDYYNHGKADATGFVFLPTQLANPSQVNVFEDITDLVTDEDGARKRTSGHGTRYNVLHADGAVVNVPIVQP